jgi:hypothetical protein
MEHKVTTGASAAADVLMNSDAGYGLKFKNVYKFECYDKNGKLKWTEEVPNLVVNEGLNELLTQFFKGSAYTASFFVGLKLTGSVVAGDTMASHGGWAESSAYSNANRPTLTLGAVASQSVDNSASKAVFNINASATITGAFVTTNNTVGGTTGKLYGAADFGASRSVISGDTLNVTVTLTAS